MHSGKGYLEFRKSWLSVQEPFEGHQQCSLQKDFPVPTSPRWRSEAFVSSSQVPNTHNCMICFGLMRLSWQSRSPGRCFVLCLTGFKMLYFHLFSWSFSGLLPAQRFYNGICRIGGIRTFPSFMPALPSGVCIWRRWMPPSAAMVAEDARVLLILLPPRHCDR